METRIRRRGGKLLLDAEIRTVVEMGIKVIVSMCIEIVYFFTRIILIDD